MMTTWYAHVRIEKNGEWAEHKGLIDIEAERGAPAPTTRVVESTVTALITHQAPYVKGGRITHRDIRRIR